MGYSRASAEDAAKKAARKLAVKPKLGANRMVCSIKKWQNAWRASGVTGTCRTLKIWTRNRLRRPAEARFARAAFLSFLPLSAPPTRAGRSRSCSGRGDKRGIALCTLGRGADVHLGQARFGLCASGGTTSNVAANAAGNFGINISQLSLLGKRWLAGAMLAGLRTRFGSPAAR